MATLQIQRSDERSNRRRNFKIIIDGAEAGTVENGELKSFQLSPGSHSVQATIDWCSSPEVNVYLADGTTQTLHLGAFKNARIFSFLPLVIIALHFLLWILFNFHYAIILFPLAFLPVFYYLTFGRNKYLTLE